MGMSKMPAAGAQAAGAQAAGVSPAEVLADGVSVALLTPVDTEGEVDLPAVDRLVAGAVSGGVVGVSPTGSTGEGTRLTGAQRRAVVRRVCAGAGAVPVVAGVASGPVADVRAEIEAVAEEGARGVLIPPPRPYALGAEEVARWYAAVADSSPLPVVLYHFPALGGPVPAEGVRRLAEHPRVVGLKDSGRDLEYLRSVVRMGQATESGFRVVTGADTLLPESLAAGAVGAIAASPNVVPTWAPELDRLCRQALRTGEAEYARGVRERRDRLADLVAACRGPGFPAGWKAAAALVGRCGADPVHPGLPVSSEVQHGMRASLAEIGVFSAAE